MKRQYKTYLFSGGKVPRSTAWFRRKRNAERLKEWQERHTSTAENLQGPPEHHQEAEGLVLSTSQPQTANVQPPTCQSTSTTPPDLSRGLNHSLHEKQNLQSADQNDLDSLPSTSSISLSGQNQLSSEVSSESDEDLLSAEQMSSTTTHTQNSNLDVSANIDCTDEDQNLSCDADEEIQALLDNNSLKSQSEKITLCPCSKSTVGDVVYMCLVLGLRHNLSWEAQVDILKMIDTIYGSSKIPTTKYSYLKILDTDSEHINFHVYCSQCECYLGPKDEKEGIKLCQNCDSEMKVSDASNFFVSVSMEHQFRTLLQNPYVADTILTYRFNRSKPEENVLTDIYDGACYKQHSDGQGILSSPLNFSYNFFTDGIPMGKSSNKTIWPIYLTINELPVEDRCKFMVLAGLYIGPKDPNHQYFLKPFVQEANKLSQNGFSWVHNNEEVVSRVIPMCAIVDSVARYQLLQFKSFASYYGCTFCYQKSERTRSGLRFTLPKKQAEQRTAQSTVQDIQVAHAGQCERKESDRHYRGVKGVSPLLNLTYFNIILGFSVDYMHAILLGVIRLHTELLFDPTRKKFWLDMEDNRLGMIQIRNVTDERLLTIKPPTSITRVPRSLKDVKLWKASEWRSWLLFYCISCLKGLLRDKYLVHLAMLSKATHILLQKSMSLSDIQEAHYLLMAYTFHFQRFFGEENMVYNIHLLSHISKGIINWGPMWGHNSFWYESQNRHLLQLCKSPSNVVLHVTRKFHIYNSLPLMCKSLVSSAQTVKFSESILGRNLKKYIRCTEGCVLLGKGESCRSLSRNEVTAIREFSATIYVDECLAYRRMIYRRKRFTAVKYQENKKNNDSCVLLSSGKFALIQNIIKTKHSKALLLVQEVIVDQAPYVADHIVTYKNIHEVVGYGSFFAIEQSKISCQAIFMHILNSHFVAKVPFGCSGD